MSNKNKKTNPFDTKTTNNIVQVSLGPIGHPESETEDEIKEILDEYDPYENGYIEKSTIEIEILEDGTLKLAKPLYFSDGQ